MMELGMMFVYLNTYIFCGVSLRDATISMIIEELILTIL